MKILCLGASFTGRYLHREFPEHLVYFASRQADLEAAGGLRRFDPGQDRADAILDTVPAIADGAEPRDPPYTNLVAALLRADPALPLVHISSTSVFAGSPRARRAAAPGTAETQAEIYDENTAPAPDEERGRLRWRLEERIRALFPGVTVLRAGGIYGPGRSLAEQFRRGDVSRASGGNVRVSRIHVHDLVRLFLAIATRRRAGESVPAVVHAVDERPTSNREVFEFLERELNLTLPDGDWRDAAPYGRVIQSRYARDLLGGAYRFPDYVTGFRDCLRAGIRS